MSVYDKATEEWFSKRPGQESAVEQCDQCGLFYKPSLGHKCKVKAEEKAMTVEEAIEGLKSWLDTETQILENARESAEMVHIWGKEKLHEKYLENVKESEKSVEKFRMAIKALEKQIPKKVKFEDGVFLGKPCKYPCCPTCNGNFNGGEWWNLNCCPDCGQRLDWSRDE